MDGRETDEMKIGRGRECMRRRRREKRNVGKKEDEKKEVDGEE